MREKNSGTTVDSKSIVTSLKIIKTVCDDNKVCNTCPFYNNDDYYCTITEIYPSDWQIKDDGKVWRAFKQDNKVSKTSKVEKVKDNNDCSLYDFHYSSDEELIEFLKNDLYK